LQSDRFGRLKPYLNPTTTEKTQFHRVFFQPTTLMITIRWLVHPVSMTIAKMITITIIKSIL
jgi:hypothetical protein